jgi:cysteinyl-tRNA synthetase
VAPTDDGTVTLRLRNTLTRAVEPVVPLETPAPGRPPRVRMYTCGPTVYRYAHVGNLRSFLLADFVRRALLYHGFEVLHVKNITDVGHMRDERRDAGGDRLVLAAEVEGKTTQQIADYYEAAFHADEAAVNILPAHRFPRATEHVPQMLALAERLVDGGFAYATPDGTVYFDVSAFPGYGQLSGNTLDELREGHRVEVEPDKDDPADFALWKHAEEGRLLKWPTARWGEGFPGWHLECSAMSLAYLGDQFEIHTGGIDNVFPHHEDEIAQSAAATGRLPAVHWVHGEHLLMRGRKMAKSAGNFQRVTELIDDGLDPLSLRYLALTSRYRRKLDYSDESLKSVAAGLDSLRSKLRTLGPAPSHGPWRSPTALEARPAGNRPVGAATHAAGHGSTDTAPFPLIDRASATAAPLSQHGQALHQRFVDAVDDDLDLPRALATVREILRSDLPDDERRWLTLDADLVLGLDLHHVWDGPEPDSLDDGIPTLVEQLLSDRAVARAARDFTAADAARDRITALGYEVIDSTDGTSVRRR